MHGKVEVAVRGMLTIGRFGVLKTIIFMGILFSKNLEIVMRISFL